jgi:hypothetical protein
VVEVDGLLNLDDFAAETGVRLPPGPYETVAGHIMAALGRIPATGDAVDAAGCRLSVVRMDGRRVARVRVVPQPQRAGARPATPGAASGTAAPAGPGESGTAAPAESGESGTAAPGRRVNAHAEGGVPTTSDGVPVTHAATPPARAGDTPPASDNASNGA